MSLTKTIILSILFASHVSLDAVLTLINSPKIVQFDIEILVLLNVPFVRNPSPPILLLLNVTDNVLMFVLLALKMIHLKSHYQYTIPYFQIHYHL